MVARDWTVTAARPQRDCHALGLFSLAWGAATVSDSQLWTMSKTASACVMVRLRSNPTETSVVSRICARSGEADSGSTRPG
jgi:hypothetical protein